MILFKNLLACSVQLAVLAGLVLIIPTQLQAQEMENNQRIVFLGDSITQSGNGPGGYVTLVREALKASHPDQLIEIIGAGISGNKVPDLQKRLTRDVLDKNPSKVVIYIGINDVWHSAHGKGTPIETFESGLNDIISQIKAAGASVVLCTPSTIGEKHDGSNELDEMLTEFSAVSRKVAATHELKLLDLRKNFIDYLKANNQENKERGVLTTDGVHLNKAGNEFVASQMLQAISVQPSDRVLRHVVMFKFQDGLEQEKVDEVVAEFAALAGKIDSIIDFEKGTNISPENLDQGYTHCFVVTFADEVGRDAYLPHPAHLQFVEFIGGKIDQVLVFDYWSK